MNGAPHDDVVGLLRSFITSDSDTVVGEGQPTLDWDNLDPVAASRTQDRLVNAGHLDAAEVLLGEWIARRPAGETHVAWLELARIHLWRGRPREAHDVLERLAVDRPSDTWVTSLLAQVELRLGRVERARALFQAAAADPANHEAQLFLGGDVAADVERARRLLTHGQLAQRGRIELAALCEAIDFRRGRRVTIESGELSQAFLDRANLMLDGAAPGDDVDLPASLRAACLRTERYVYYTSHAFGDTLLGLAAVSALLRFFERYPEARRPVEIVSPYADVLGGLAERESLVTCRAVCAPRDPDEASGLAEDLAARTERTFTLSNSSPDVIRSLAEVARDRTDLLAVVDLFVDRYVRNLAPWQSLVAPLAHVTSYPGRLHRFMEMVLGCKLVAHPRDVIVRLPLSRALRRRGRQTLERYGLLGCCYHAVIESASKRSKMFAPGLLARLLEAMAADAARRERQGGPRERIVFCADPWMTDSFAARLHGLPSDVRARIIVAEDDLVTLTGLLAEAATVVSTDTGLAHLAGALGRPTLILYSMADPFLWTTGGTNVQPLFTRHALAAHVNHTPVNMHEWEIDEPVMGESISAAELTDAWRRLPGPRGGRGPRPTFPSPCVGERAG